MQLISIDKLRYRQHLNIVIGVFIGSFLILAVGFGTLFITLFGASDADNFWLNVAGVGLAFVLLLATINAIKNNPFMAEVYYVWQLKHQINLIYRKLKKIKKLAFTDKNINAIIILSFYYQACQQLYNLDDNTITMATLTTEHNHLQDFINSHNLTIVVENYHQQLLKTI